MTNVLPIPLTILTYCGFWRPSRRDKPKIAAIAYDIYSLTMRGLIYAFTASHLFDIIIEADNLENLAGNCFMLLSMLNVCCKITVIVYFNDDIRELLDILTNGRCLARDAIEREISEKNRERARRVTLFYWALTETTCMLITARTFFLTTDKILPFKAWIPYDTSTNVNYWLTFFHQTIAHVVAANVQIANETLVCGLLINASSQLEMLKQRLKSITDDCVDFESRSVELIDCLEHHRRIKQFSAKLNNTFNVIIFFQFVISSLVLCSSVYLLSKMNMLSVQFMSLILYLSCMLYQIFLFCYYGNDCIIQSSDLVNATYNMDWTKLNLRDKKDLIRTMLLIRKPIKFTSSFLITLSIESYCKLLKMSYSVFNLLQRTSI